MVGSYRHYALGNLKVKSALYFALPSILSLLIVRKILLPKIPHTLFFIDGFEVTKDLLIMIVFALLMMAASLSMIRKTKTVETAVVHFPRLALIGLLVGVHHRIFRRWRWIFNYSGVVNFLPTFR